MVVGLLKRGTDSLIFKLKEEIPVELFQNAPVSGLSDPIQIPDWDQMPPLVARTVLVGLEPSAVGP